MAANSIERQHRDENTLEWAEELLRRQAGEGSTIDTSAPPPHASRRTSRELAYLTAKQQWRRLALLVIDRASRRRPACERLLLMERIERNAERAWRDKASAVAPACDECTSDSVG